MIHTNSWLLSAAAIAATFGCSAPATVPPTNARPTAESVLAVHRDSLRAHIERDWQWFGRDIADPTIAVSRGEIRQEPAEDTLKRFRAYLGRTEFSRYEDLEEPIVFMSPDGQMALLIVRVIVEGQQTLDDGRRPVFSTTFAWASLFQRRAGRWVRVATISTNAPASERVAKRETGISGSGLSATGALSGKALALWKEAQRAMGGAVAIEAVRSITARADVTAPGGVGRLTVESHADGRLRFDQQTSAGQRNLVELSRTGDGDRVHKNGGTEPLAARMSAFVRGHELHMMALAPALHYSGGAADQAEQFGGRMCDVIKFEDAYGKPVRVYLDSESKLPAGFVLVEPESSDDAPITFVLSGWQPFGTLRLFTTVEIEHRGARFRYDYREIRLNEASSFMGGS